jgi:hypothetical protein
MNLKQLFTRKNREAVAQPAEAAGVVVPTELDLDALEDCVGGRAEADDVGCYAQSTGSNVH